VIQPRTSTYIVCKLGKGQAADGSAPPGKREGIMEDRNVRGAAAGEATYSVAARRFHWWVFALLAVQIPVGLFMVRYGAATNFAEPTGKLYDGHKVLGLVILLLVIARLVYRLVNGAPPDEPTLQPWERIVSHATHWAIYALLIVVPLLGWLAISYYGPFAPFGIKLPSLAAQDDARATQMFFVHMAAAYVLIVLLAMHVAAALQHYLIKKDGVLRRMLVRAGRLG
jgi:cytochrome b561